MWRGLLVSVRDAEEAAAALAGGAAIIDVKDPDGGSLGAATPAVIAEVAGVVGGLVPWTVAAGELAAEIARPGRFRRWLDEIMVGAGTERHMPAAVKLGLAGMGRRDWRPVFRRVMDRVPAATTRVAVAYADWSRVDAPHPFDVVVASQDAGCTVLLVDTADKQGPGLLGACPAEQLAGWTEAARVRGMRVALAGRLRLDEVVGLRPFQPDVVAVRTAVCSNGRSGPVEAALVRRAVAVTLDLERSTRAAARNSCAPLAGP